MLINISQSLSKKHSLLRTKPRRKKTPMALHVINMPFAEVREAIIFQYTRTIDHHDY